MCFSAQVWADYRKYTKAYGATVSIQEFLQLLQRRSAGERIILPKGLTDAFKAAPDSEKTEQCRDLVLAFEAAEATRIETDLFKQRRRLADAERKLATKLTKGASEEQRIAGNLIARHLVKLDDLKRTEHKDRDDRVYAGSFCPVMVRDAAGQLVVRPMRYQCRPAGMPAAFDRRYPGLYNARRDNLTGFWKNVYAHTHAVVVAEAFLEHVDRHRLEGRALAPDEEAQDVVIQFAPGDGQLMQFACLWSHWTGRDEPDLLSFALVTDEPPPEVAMAGHDRCPIPLKSVNVDAWLAAPAPTDFQALLDDRERPYYAHQLAAAA
jgi:putative SOS response-associated peptidase YedK